MTEPMHAGREKQQALSGGEPGPRRGAARASFEGEQGLGGAGPGAGAPAPQLYVVATPLGNLADASPRVRALLAGVPVIACEDTRRTWQLLSALGIPRPELFSYRQGNEEQVSARISGLVRAGAPGARG